MRQRGRKPGLRGTGRRAHALLAIADLGVLQGPVGPPDVLVIAVAGDRDVLRVHDPVGPQSLLRHVQLEAVLGLDAVINVFFPTDVP